MAGAAAHRVELPGGYVADDGRVHTEVELVPLDGAAEAALADAPADTCAARLMTLLLTHGLRRVGSITEVTAPLVRDLLVEDREYLVLRLRERTLGPQVWVALGCPHEGCGQELEVKLMLDEMTFDRRPVTSRHFVSGADPSCRFRLPVGGDQELASSSGLTDPDALRDFLLARCLGRPHDEAAALPPALKDAIEDQIEGLVPDVAVEVAASCPVCRRPMSAQVDLAFHAVRDLWVQAQRVEQEVHLLAWNYHWSERDILALPRRKRERYVRMVEQELEARGV